MARRTTAWTALAVAALAASAAAGAHAARDLKYAGVGEEFFGDGWAANLIEAGLDPLIEQLSRPSIDRITNWATAQTSGTFA